MIDLTETLYSKWIWIMIQSNALRKLESILDEVITEGNDAETSGSVLLRTMRLDQQPQNIIDFYGVLSKAEEEAIKLKNLPRFDRYFQVIEELHKFCIINHIWTTRWKVFATHIKSKNVFIALDELANYFHSQNSKVFLEEKFINKLNAEFESLLSKILESDLSEELKNT